MIWYVIIRNARLYGVFKKVGYNIINKRRWVICDPGGLSNCWTEHNYTCVNIIVNKIRKLVPIVSKQF